MLGRTEPTVRQLAHRARKAVDGHRRYDSDPVVARKVAELFLAACLDGDVVALLDVLAPDVTLVSDGGGLTGAPRRPIRGAPLVARAIVVLARQRPAHSTFRVADLNGGPGLTVHAGDTPLVAMTLHLAGGVVVRTVHAVSNPRKLTAVTR